jgi:hypothetical protein
MYACTRASYFVRMRARLTGGIDWIVIDWEWRWGHVGGGEGGFHRLGSYYMNDLIL